MIHADAIKMLMPIDLGLCSDADIAIEGAMLDKALQTINSLLNEAFPSTATTQTIQRWEKEHAVTALQSITDRRNAVVAKIRQRTALKNGGLSKKIYISIASALGYDINLVESGAVFRAGINAAGDAVYSSSVLYALTVVVNNASSADDLVALFTNIMPPDISLTFTFV